MSTVSAASDSHSLKAPGDSDVDAGKKDWKAEADEAVEGRCEATVGPSSEDTALERRAMVKLDLTVLPVMTMFYLLSFLDRANIGNARIAGLQAALRLTDHQYQICVTILYVPYICTELPANLILRKVGANILMPTILTAWGVVVTFQGFVSSYEGLLAVRFLLGLLEGPMFSGIVLYLSEGFYTRRDLSLRISYFFSAASLSGAFSGLLAAAISKMDGIGGKDGWAWIFILEGLFTVVAGVASFWMVPRTLQHAFWLTQEEKDALTRRFERDRPAINTKDKFTPKEILRSLLSPHVILMFFVTFMGGTVLYGLALFLPSIVRQLGFSPLNSQLLSVGPFAVGFVGLNSKYALYGALYFMVPGIYAASPVSCAWIANNSEPYYRRASSIAITFAGINAGGILSTWRFPTKEGPRFTKTAIMVLTFLCLAVFLTGLNMLYLHWQNKRKQRLRNQILAPYATEKEPDGGIRAWIDLGDKHPDFKYTL